MVSLAIALPPPSVHEIRLESDMFVTRLNFDFTIAHCEPRVSDLLDYTADEITGMNMYTLCHGEDAHRLRKNHIDLISKGQVLTHYYRVMNKNGGYTWIQTCATVVCNSKNAEEQNIICVNYVLSGREYKNLIMDCCQLEDHVAARSVKREDTSGNDPENGSPGSDTGEGRSSGGGHHPERHLAGPDLEEDGTEGPSDQRGRGIMDHSTQLHEHPQINNALVRPVKKSMSERRGVKRKVGDEESSCCSSDEDDRVSGLRKRYPVLSPASSSCHSSAIASSPKAPPEDSDGGGTSVKDLEQAMSKHLPAMDKVSTPSHQPTDFSTDTLLKAQQQRSTIQWIGTHHHLSHLAAGTGQQQGLPASTLLRQLYAANRESVIRANVTAARSGPGYYPDMNHSGPLPTPPGSDGSYSDQFVLHNQNGIYSGNGYSVDYHSAMTPPSSVSPRDKHNQQLHSGFESPVYSEVLRHQYLGGEAPAQPLPLKPQPYPMHPGALDYATTSLDQQFYHHSTPATGFHLYHPSNKTSSASPGVYTDPLKNTTNWYSTPS